MLHALVAYLAIAPAGLQQQQSTYPVFETDKISPAEHKIRRQKVMQQMGPGSIGVFFTNPVRNRNNDVDFLFRGDSNFLYLTGFEEPDAVLVLVPDGVELNGRTVKEVLFVNVADPFSETWLGYRMGPDNVTKLLGIEASFSNRDFATHWPTLVAGAKDKKLVVGQVPSDQTGQLGRMIGSFKEWQTGAGFSSPMSGRGIVNQMRGVKSPAEIQLIKKAAEISARAHIEAIRSAEPGMREWEIGALVKYIFAKEGCEYEGYPAICGSGPNSTILHYNTNRRLMQAGDIMCMDTAGEFHGYTADVTRSYPINGKFTKEQRAIYNIVLRAQEAGIRACRAGTAVRDVEKACSDELAKGLMELGLIENASDLRRYYMHGFGHGLGLDVHDPMPGTLQAGVVLTVEPGIYIKAGSPCDPKWWNIGVRIEDDIVVTEGNPINLSIGCPRSADEIERMMVDKGLGNIVPKPLGAGKPEAKPKAASKSGKGRLSKKS